MLFSRRLATALALAPFAPAAQAATGRAVSASPSAAHRVAVHINYRDPSAVNLTLNNVQNLYEYFRAQKQPIDVRIVTHGPGLHMLRDDTSSVKDRLGKMKSELSTLTFAACANTRGKMEKKRATQFRCSRPPRSSHLASSNWCCCRNAAGAICDPEFIPGEKSCRRPAF